VECLFDREFGCLESTILVLEVAGHAQLERSCRQARHANQGNDQKYHGCNEQRCPALQAAWARCTGSPLLIRGH
jgi:hypothetical protein